MIAQLVLDGLVTGLLIALPALSFTVVFGVMKFANFAIGAMMTFGAYVGWTANQTLGLPIAAAAALAAVATAAAGVLSEILVYRRLRDRGAMALLVVSMGVSLVLENICRFIYGNTTRSYDVAIGRPTHWLGLRVRQEQIITASVVIGLLVVFQILLRATSLGRAMRAVADNAPLAAVRGIERDTVGLLTWAMAGGLAALAGVLSGLDSSVQPLLGDSYQIPVFAAAILGGLGSPLGAVAGALTIGVAEELSSLVIPTEYRQAISFALILLLLMVRSRGLFGARAMRK